MSRTRRCRRCREEISQSSLIGVCKSCEREIVEEQIARDEAKEAFMSLSDDEKWEMIYDRLFASP